MGLGIIHIYKVVDEEGVNIKIRENMLTSIVNGPLWFMVGWNSLSPCRRYPHGNLNIIYLSGLPQSTLSGVGKANNVDSTLCVAT